MVRGSNYGSHTWSRGTIGGAVFGLAGPLAAWTTCSVTSHTLTGSLCTFCFRIFPSLIIFEHHLLLVSIYQGTLIGNCF